MRYLFQTISIWLVAIAVWPAHAAPYIPENGSQVIERLPGRKDPAVRELKRLRAELSANPNNLALAIDLARRYINLAREEGDPRYTGYAQAALSPWWNQPQPPAQVRVLRATILQSSHQFQQALADLDAVLKNDRNNAQAWLTRATILQVQGEYERAKNSCARLAGLVDALITQTCLSNIASLNGNAAEAYGSLQAALQNAPDASPGIKTWVLTLLAEMAVRRGDATAAEKHFRQALVAGSPDTYLLGAYSDFLLEQDRAAEVVDLLKDKTRIDGLLLRYALALKRQNRPEAQEHRQALATRFADAMLRGDTVHQREQARYELELAGNPDAALKIAQQNWQIQKEPADARILMEAALAANNKAAAEPVLQWLKETRLEDQALQRLTSRLEAR